MKAAVSKKGPAEVLVVDHVHKTSTENWLA
jgi:hypothetical protein